jgi:SP family arabinose:H+ symporter-like MFS transporter
MHVNPNAGASTPAATTDARHRGFVVGISLIAALGGLLFGFDLGVITGVIPFISGQFSLEGFGLGWVVAIFEIGCMAGTFVTAALADRLGRKKSLQLTAVSFIFTTLGVALAGSASGLALWRLLQGVGVGAASVLSPMYIAEIAPAGIRGKLVAFNQFTIILGILLATVSCYYFGRLDQPESWRWMFGSALLPSVLFALLLFLIPESPRWLVRRGQDERAASVLRKIGSDAFVDHELSHIQQSLRQTQREGSYRALSGPNVLPIVLVGTGLAVLQQFCGANNITGYLQVIFQKARMDISDGLLNAVGVMGVFLVFTVLAIVLIDRLGRRKLLLAGTSLMAFFLLLLAFTFNSEAVDGRLVLLLVMGYIATFAFTLGPVVWVLLSEIFPNYIRSKALSLCSGLLWMATFAVVLVSPSLLKVSPVANFLLFAVFNLVGFIFVWRYVPETKGKSLEELESLVLARRKR